MGKVLDLAIEPQTSKTITLDIPLLPRLKRGQKYMLNFTCKTKNRKGLVEAGNELAWEQFTLR